MQADNDAGLVRQAVGGDAGALAALARRYYRPVGAFLLKRVGEPDLVEDLVQETFLEAFQALKAGRAPEHFSSWLFGIAQNRWGKWARRRKPLPLADSDPPAGAAPDPLEEAEHHRALVARLETGLAELPDETRRLLELKHKEGKTCDEIAAATGRPVGTVKSLLSRAYRALRQRLGSPEGTPP